MDILKSLSKKSYARKLRQKQTRGERKLWPLLLLGYKAQQLAYGYIPDYYSPLFRVAVEVSGRWKPRELKAKEKLKIKHLKHWGIHTVLVSDRRAELAACTVLLEVIITSMVWSVFRLVRTRSNRH